MENPAARLSWADYTASRGRFFDRLSPMPTDGGLILTEDDVNAIRTTEPAPVPALEAAWCSRWPEEVAACFTPDGIRHQLALPEARFQGRASIARAAGAIVHALPDLVVEVVEVVRGPRTTVLEWVLRGTQVEDLPGLPARGTRVELPGVSVCRMEGALIAEERVYAAAPAPPAGAGAG